MRRLTRLAKEGSWLVLGNLFAALGAIVLVRALTEYLSPSEYGQLSLSLTLALLVNQVIMGGLRNGVARHYAIAKESFQVGDYLYSVGKLYAYATGAVFLLQTLLFGVLALAHFWQWAGVVLAAFLFALLTGYNGAMSAIQNAARQRTVVAFHTAAVAWGKVLFAVVLLLWLGRSPTSAMSGFILATGLVMVSQYFFLHRLLSQETAHCRKGYDWTGRIWAYSWPFSAWGIFTWAQLSSDRWALGLFTTTNEVGLYSALLQVGYAPITLAAGTTMSFLGPILFQRAGSGNDAARNKEVQHYVWQLAGFGAFVTMLAFLAALPLHRELFGVLVSDEYLGVSYLLPWVLLAACIFAIGEIFGIALSSEMRTKELMWVKIGTACFAICFNLAGGWLFGIHGVVASVLVSSLFFCSVMARKASRVCAVQG